MRQQVVVVGDLVDDLLVSPLERVTHDSDTRASIRWAAGGSAANQAAWLGRLGVPVRFVGRVGAADVTRHAGLLRSQGVEPLLVADDERPTATIVVLLGDDGSRTMFVDRGASVALSPADLPPSLLDGAALLVVSGYGLMEPGPRATVLAAIVRARHAGVPIALDPSSCGFLRGLDPVAFLGWTAGAALCFPNRDEAEVLTGLDGDSPEALVRRLCETYGVVACKLGAEGVVVGEAGAVPVHVPAPRVEVVDPTGAGDAFCAGFVARWLAGADPVAATEGGIACAAQAVTQLGGRP